METSAFLVLHVLFPFQTGTECSVQHRAKTRLQDQLPEAQLKKTKQERIIIILKAYVCVLNVSM